MMPTPVIGVSLNCQLQGWWHIQRFARTRPNAHSTLLPILANNPSMQRRVCSDLALVRGEDPVYKQSVKVADA
jgi:hypothetical protein